ncbi:unnamed protein product [Arabis nemorensis]|uniref:Uncharacterized protein n=1 Tax=Arabis nemorensis TaxID=586526 RepID=A0A565ANG3_9BRAS|nr:unnamed protein product [Arabis nemorensis]
MAYDTKLFMFGIDARVGFALIRSDSESGSCVSMELVSENTKLFIFFVCL